MDGQELRVNPAASMEIIQKFLGITPFLNYTRTLRWESISLGKGKEVLLGRDLSPCGLGGETASVGPEHPFSLTPSGLFL